LDKRNDNHKTIRYEALLIVGGLFLFREKFDEKILVMVQKSYSFLRKEDLTVGHLAIPTEPYKIQ